MKLFPRFFSLLLILLVPVEASAQDEESLEDFRLIHNPGNTLQTSTNTEVIGTPLYNEEWEYGHVIFKSGKESERVRLIFNSYSGELFFKKDDNVTRKLDLAGVRGFKFEKSGEVFETGFTSEDFDITPTTPLRMIYNGDTKLVVLHQTAKKSGNSKDPITGKITDRYIPFETFLIIREDGSFKKTRIRKKNLLKDLGDHKKEMEDFLKRTDNKVKTEGEAARLISFYDTLD